MCTQLVSAGSRFQLVADGPTIRYHMTTYFCDLLCSNCLDVFKLLICYVTCSVMVTCATMPTNLYTCHHVNVKKGACILYPLCFHTIRHVWIHVILYDDHLNQGLFRPICSHFFGPQLCFHFSIKYLRLPFL